MGWSTWYQYSQFPTEREVLTQARAMRADGLLKAGYAVITIDDGWQGTTPAERAAGAPLTWNAQEFPHGIPWLARQLHGLGFKLGIYTAIGRTTCFDRGTGAAGSQDHYAGDAALFRSWGVSFVKIDDCRGRPSGITDAALISDYTEFSKDIAAEGMQASTEAPIFVHPWDADAAVAQASVTDAQWRVHADEAWTQTPAAIVIGHLEADLPLARYARPGHWNDLDMLVPGNLLMHPFGFTLADEESQLAVWAMEASPLILSTNVPALTTAELAPLADPWMIAVDESGAQASLGGVTGSVQDLYKPVDESGAQASLGGVTGSVQYLYKPVDGGVAVLLANTGTARVTVTLPFSRVGVTARTEHVRQVFGTTWTAGSLRAVLAPGQAELFVLTSA